MRKNMAPKNKHKRNKKVVNKRASINKKSPSRNQKKSNDFFLILFESFNSKIVTLGSRQVLFIRSVRRYCLDYISREGGTPVR